jgi:hypothetical protein
MTPNRRDRREVTMSNSNQPSTAEPLAGFARQSTVLLTTFRRDGTGVGTAVSLAVDGAHGYFRTWDTAGKAKRLHNNPAVTVAPSTIRGRARGPAVPGTALLLSGAQARRAARLLAGRHRLLQGFLVPLAHRLLRYRTLHYELTLAAGEP